MSGILTYNFGNLTKLGEEKSFNTDSIIDFPIFEGHVFIVCDGHDGEEGHGALAAKITSESIKKYFHNKSYKDTISALTNAVSFANYSVYKQATSETKYNNICSTLAVLIFKNNKIYYAYAGDSRIYLYQNNKLTKLTLDHVTDINNAAESDVTILVGKNKDIKFGVCKNPLKVSPDDRFLVCTDGISDTLNSEELTDVIGNDDTSPDHKALILEQRIKEKNGKDNFSAYIVEFTDKVAKTPKKINISKKQIIISLSVLVGLVLIVLVGIFFKNRPIPNNEDEIAIETTNNTLNKPDNEQIIENSSNNIENKKETSAKQIETPKPKKEEHKAQTTAEATNTEGTFCKHKIQYGENLYRLALRYGVSQKQLVDINGDLATRFIAGNIIKIPVKAIHIVKSGESYSILSDKYNIKINSICRTNKTDKNTPLSKGAKVIIPLK